VWIYGRLDFTNLKHAILQLAWWTVPVVTTLALTIISLQALRWWILLRAFATGLPFLRALKHHLTGTFYSIIVPSGAGQDLVRAVLMGKEVDYAVVWGATWCCRLLGLATLALFSLFGLLSLQEETPPIVTRVVLCVGAMLGVLVVLSFSKRFTRPVRDVLGRLIPNNLLEISEKVRQGIYGYRHKKKHLAVVLAVTALLQLMFIANASVILKGMTGNSYLRYCLAFIPLIEIVAIAVPLTPNGMGLRELMLAIMFERLGLSRAELGVYVAVAMYTMLLKLVGGIPLLWALFKGTSKRHPGECSECRPKENPT
jgi:uncharacterized protein (TIRG00374 family)